MISHKALKSVLTVMKVILKSAETYPQEQEAKKFKNICFCLSIRYKMQTYDNQDGKNSSQINLLLVILNSQIFIKKTENTIASELSYY